MARASAENVDREIEKWLGEICRNLDLDRCAVYERSSRDEPVRVTHTWLREGFPPFPRDFNPEKHFKATTEWVMRGNIVSFSDPRELPLELEDARRFVERWGPRASLALPMRFGSEVMGAVSFGKFRSHREWPARLIQRLSVVVQIFGSAIERKVMETRFQRTLAELTDAARRATLGEFAASIVHEVNQPLGAILSNLEGVQHAIGSRNANHDRAEVSAALERAIADVKRAASVVRRIRSLFKAKAAVREAIDPVSLFEETSSLVRTEAMLKRIALQVSVEPGLPRILGDRVQLQQCLLNLIANAFDAICSSDSPKRQVTVRAGVDSPQWVFIRVSDSGPGIEPSLRDRVFDPFVTTRREGLGIGLMVVRAIVENHGGTIRAVLGEDGGATFQVRLPASARRIVGGRRAHTHSQA